RRDSRKKSSATVTAISSLLTLGAAAFATPTLAADKVEMEKCYGVVKAGKNDCAAPAHACAGPGRGGAGIGLRAPHHLRVLSDSPAVAWFEAHTENYFADGGAHVEVLAR